MKDLTVHLLTKNNEATIDKALESLLPLNCPILIADRGSTDRTITIAENYGAQIFRVPFMTRDQARNHVLKSRWKMYIEPWEVLTMGHQEITKVTHGAHRLTVINNGVITKEVRLWDGPQQFINPVFEYLQSDTNKEVAAVIFSKGGVDPKEGLAEIELWKSREPMLSEPYYYQACLLLAEGRYEEFLKISEHFMFLNKSQTVATTMNRYYYALTQVYHKKKARPAIQNLILCLVAKPLMAEFWCLMGDVHYHLLNDFDKAKHFYLNAMALGKHRLKTDKWPMEIAKYKAYPEKMIASCEEILKTRFFAKS